VGHSVNRHLTALALACALTACGSSHQARLVAQDGPGPVAVESPSETPSATPDTPSPTPARTPSATPAPATTSAAPVPKPPPGALHGVTRLGDAAPGPAVPCSWPTVQTPRRIEGVVVDTHGDPQAGMYVGGGCAQVAPEVRTDAAGRFSVPCTDRKDWAWVMVSPLYWDVGHLGTSREPRRGGDFPLGFANLGGSQPYECGAKYRMVLEPAAAIRVHVQRTDGTPADREVELTMTDPGPWPLWQNTANSVTRFPELAPGTYELRLWMTEDTAKVTVKAGETKDVTITFTNT
jgi:hypothetical protein